MGIGGGLSSRPQVENSSIGGLGVCSESSAASLLINDRRSAAGSWSGAFWGSNGIPQSALFASKHGELR